MTLDEATDILYEAAKKHVLQMSEGKRKIYTPYRKTLVTKTNVYKMKLWSNNKTIFVECNNFIVRSKLLPRFKTLVQGKIVIL